MQKEGLLEHGLNMMYLAACALNDEIPDESRLRRMDLARIYELAKFHSVQVIVYLLLRRCIKQYGDGFIDAELLARWQRSYSREVKRLVMLDLERERLAEFLDGKGCRYLCLKGVVLHNYYSHIGMRQMADNDILVDPEFAPDIRNYMTGAGYHVYSYGTGCHDVYDKNGLYFEIHRKMVSGYGAPQIVNYYESIEDKLIPTGKGTEQRLSDEDFYIYFLCHAYKHYSGSGYGVRFLMDTYAYTRRVWSEFDHKYLAGELSTLLLTDFESLVRTLSYKLFSGGEVDVSTLSERESELLLFCLSAGTFGTYKTHVENTLHRMAKGKPITLGLRLRYLFRRIFPEFAYYKGEYPVMSKYIVTIPVIWFIRLVRMFARSHNVAEELRQLKKAK